MNERERGGAEAEKQEQANKHKQKNRVDSCVVKGNESNKGEMATR